MAMRKVLKYTLVGCFLFGMLPLLVSVGSKFLKVDPSEITCDNPDILDDLTDTIKSSEPPSHRILNIEYGAARQNGVVTRDAVDVHICLVKVNVTYVTNPNVPDSDEVLFWLFVKGDGQYSISNFGLTKKIKGTMAKDGLVGRKS
jgi:hypothetical protein